MSVQTLDNPVNPHLPELITTMNVKSADFEQTGNVVMLDSGNVTMDRIPGQAAMIPVGEKKLEIL